MHKEGLETYNDLIIYVFKLFVHLLDKYYWIQLHVYHDADQLNYDFH